MCKSLLLQVCPDNKAGDVCRTAVHDFEGHQTYTEKRGHDFALNADFDTVHADSFDALLTPGMIGVQYDK